ncbi:GPP34 family phosphoprotein [Kitasatospora paracochleata]|uniref:GPP34 family phosphoprotein n=1 Tax=Kitasatospora paracochleata TaxID=58354 RepID=A0ABT1J823_9ACTN|nr:GPP34 family phosphoprotein [Kitasatospora paracochleata]MCP2313587.1 hypothetical protein [Kitasatospora paracochleata]
MFVTLGEEIMLMSLDDGSGKARERMTAGWVVAGAFLLDLALAGRITAEDGRLRVVDAAPTGVRLLDGRLAAVAAWTEGRRTAKVAAWVTKDQSTAVRAAIDSLRERGLVTEERHRLLGLFPVRRYPEADGSVERELRARLTAAVLDGAEPDERTTGLIALLHGARLHRLAFPDLPRRQVEPRMAAIAEGQWAGEAVRQAIRTMQAAMVAVATTTAIAASSG